MITPARQQDAEEREHQPRHEPAQHSRIDDAQRHRSERNRDGGGDEDRHHFAPGAMPERAHGERRGARGVDQQERHGGGARIIDRGDERHVDQGRAESGKAPHQTRQGGNRERGPKTVVRNRGGKKRAVGKDHGGETQGASRSIAGRGRLGRPARPRVNTDVLCARRAARPALSRCKMARPIRILGIDPRAGE